MNKTIRDDLDSTFGTRWRNPPTLTEAWDQMTEDHARELVPEPRRDPIDVLREIGEAHFRLTMAAIDGGDLTFGAELIRRLVGELVRA